MHISAVTAAVVEDSVAKRFWNKCQDESLLPLYTPFMVCLITGSLELDTFRRYIAQDVHFLKAFAQSYEMAEDCADDDDAKTAIFELRKNVMKELKMHNFVLEVQEEVQKGLSRYVFSASRCGLKSFKIKQMVCVPRRWIRFCNPDLSPILTKCLGTEDWVQYRDEEICRQ